MGSYGIHLGDGHQSMNVISYHVCIFMYHVGKRIISYPFGEKKTYINILPIEPIDDDLGDGLWHCFTHIFLDTHLGA